LRSICFAQVIFIVGSLRLAFLADTAHGQEPLLSFVSGNCGFYFILDQMLYRNPPKRLNIPRLPTKMARATSAQRTTPEVQRTVQPASAQKFGARKIDQIAALPSTSPIRRRSPNG
jgi:hypothetical protein